MSVEAVVAVLIVVSVGIWAGIRIERIRRAAELRKATINLQAWARERRRSR